MERCSCVVSNGPTVYSSFCLSRTLTMTSFTDSGDIMTRVILVVLLVAVVAKQVSSGELFYV